MNLESKMNKVGENLSLLAGNPAMEKEWNAIMNLQNSIMAEVREIGGKSISENHPTYRLLRMINTLDILISAVNAARMGCVCCKE